MSSDKIDELASTIDDAKTDVEELQIDPNADEKRLDDLHDALQHATDVIDDIADKTKEPM